jgi:hypothetical protein
MYPVLYLVLGFATLHLVAQRPGWFDDRFDRHVSAAVCVAAWPLCGFFAIAEYVVLDAQPAAPE